MSSIYSKLKEIFKLENDKIEDKEFLNFLDGLKENDEDKNDDDNYPYPIKKSMAIEIARAPSTLKTDFCRNSNRSRVTYLGFNSSKVSVIEKDGRKYFQYQVLDGDISWIDDSDYGTTYCDGFFTSDDLKYLRCLIDVETGDYIYYPNVSKYEKRTIKYEKKEITEDRRKELREWAKKFEDE